LLRHKVKHVRGTLAEKARRQGRQAALLGCVLCDGRAEGVELAAHAGGSAEEARLEGAEGVDEEDGWEV
tara:strand:+ start:106 stop:312 length:207 start_codon:yes stop_codon:yes gene_type:complete